MLTFSFGKDKETKYNVLETILGELGINNEEEINIHINDNFTIDTFLHYLNIAKNIRDKKLNKV